MFPLFTTRCLHVRHDVRDPSGGRWNCGRKCCPTSTPFRDLLHAANLRHGTDGFTSPPKEGVLRIFSPLKIRRLRPGLNTGTWVLKASTLPLDHRSRTTISYKIVTKKEELRGFWTPHNTTTSKDKVVSVHSTKPYSGRRCLSLGRAVA